VASSERLLSPGRKPAGAARPSWPPPTCRPAPSPPDMVTEAAVRRRPGRSSALALLSRPLCDGLLVHLLGAPGRPRQPASSSCRPAHLWSRLVERSAPRPKGPRSGNCQPGVVGQLDCRSNRAQQRPAPASTCRADTATNAAASISRVSANLLFGELRGGVGPAHLLLVGRDEAAHRALTPRSDHVLAAPGLASSPASHVLAHDGQAWCPARHLHGQDAASPESSCATRPLDHIQSRPGRRVEQDPRPVHLVQQPRDLPNRRRRTSSRTMAPAAYRVPEVLLSIYTPLLDRNSEAHRLGAVVDAAMPSERPGSP